MLWVENASAAGTTCVLIVLIYTILIRLRKIAVWKQVQKLCIEYMLIKSARKVAKIYTPSHPPKRAPWDWQV